MSQNLIKLSLASVQKGLKKGDFSVQDLVLAYLERAEQTKANNAFITLSSEQALNDARASDQRLASQNARPLEGIPTAVKDVYCTKGVRTTAASRMLHDFIPPYESTVTQKMWDAGAILLGKVNLDEFCMGSTTTPEFSGACRNPWDPRLCAGGSSGGSCVAVAEGSALCALGTDTGGSIRQPASFCGVVGLKTTYGRCSRFGVVAFASSLDTPGLITRSVEDSAVLLEVIAGHDPKDATSAKQPVPIFHQALQRSVKGLKVGIPRDIYDEVVLDPAVRAMWDRGRAVLEEAGCIIVSVTLPHARYALPTYYVSVCAEAASNLQRYDGVKYGLRVEKETLEDMYKYTRGAGFGAEVKRRILLGTYVLSHGYYEAYYGKAQKVRQCIVQDFQHAFQDIDVMLMPTTPTPALSLESIKQADPVSIYANDILTVPVNMGGVCALSIPAGMTREDHSSLPLSLQIIAPAFCEERLFQFGAIIEKCMSIDPLPFMKEVL